MTEYVKAEQVFLDNPATTVDEAIDFLADKAVENGLSDDKAAVVDAFKSREAMGTTGMTGGFAIPHCKSTAVNDAAIYVVKFAGDVAWESMDGKPIKVAVALFAPDGDVHLTLLSTVATILMNEANRAAILEADDAAAVAGVLNKGLNA